MLYFFNFPVLLFNFKSAIIKKDYYRRQKMYQRIRLGYFPGGKRKALTMSFDDGRDSDRRAVEILNKHRLKGTFHLNAGKLDRPKYLTSSELAELFSGHEVSSHTFSHPHLSHVADSNFIYEVLEDRRVLEAASGQMVRGMSYPNGVNGTEIADKLRALGVVYSRLGKATGSTMIPTDFLFWAPTTSYYDAEALKKFEHFKQAKVNAYLSVYYWWTHSISIECDGAWDKFEEFCQSISGCEDIWYATNLEIWEYVTAAKNLVISADQTRIYNPSAISVWVEIGIEHPLEIPSGKTVSVPDFCDEYAY